MDEQAVEPKQGAEASAAAALAQKIAENLRRVIHAPDDREVSAESARRYASAGSHVAVYWAHGLGHRRILADADVVAQAVRFVMQPKQPVPLHLGKAMAPIG